MKIKFRLVDEEEPSKKQKKGIIKEERDEQIKKGLGLMIGGAGLMIVGFILMVFFGILLIIFLILT